MRTIAIHTSKGGVGKTTLAINVAYELAIQGNRVLVIDLDDQANASLSLGVNKADEFDRASSLEEFEKILESFEDRKEVFDFMKNFKSQDFNYREYIYSSTLNQIISRNGCPGRVDVLPSSQKTRNLDKTLAQFPQKLLDKSLKQSGIAYDYDYVIIDTPPSSTLATTNGLYAAQYTVIPSQMEYFSVYGIRNPIDLIREVQDEAPNRAVIIGIVPMMTENVILHHTMKQLLAQRYPKIKILQEIRRTTSVGQASKARLPLSLYAEQNRGAGKVANQFATLTKEIVSEINQHEISLGI
ncbi:MAG TPA: ParA family protein [Nodularia sp. (in: cyanobacteria)]|nr:ParA family protein [Nodularia sp. (in: cyanobacteria)]